MPNSSATISAIRKCLKEHLPNSGKAVLFGSQARGTANGDSDWDILVILDKEKLLPSDYDEVTYPLTMLGWEIGEEINPILYSSKEWERSKHSLFRMNVERDGILL